MARAKAPRQMRGYDAQHDRVRARWAQRVKSGSVCCARCGHPILPGMKWDLGHSDFDRSQYQGPEHQRCNRRAGAIKGNAMRRRRNVTGLEW